MLRKGFRTAFRMSTPSEIQKLRGQLASCKNEIGRTRRELKKFETAHLQQLQQINDKLDPLRFPQSQQPPSQADYTDNTQLFLQRISPIGYLESVFSEKNGTPRQGSICPTSKAKLKILFGSNPHHTLEGLENYSHVWVIFLFHANANVTLKAKVRPPQLSGERMGLFATRTPHRPNPMGLSLCKIDKVKDDTVYLSGVDIIDGTPILDIKPYIPAYDNPDLHPLVRPHPLESEDILATLPIDGKVETHNEAPDEQQVKTSYFTEVDYVKNVQKKFLIQYTPEAEAELSELVANHSDNLRFLANETDIRQAIEQVVCNEPRSLYRRENKPFLPFGFVVDNVDVTCIVNEAENSVEIRHIKFVSGKSK